MKRLLFTLACAFYFSSLFGQAAIDVDLKQLDSYFAKMTEEWDAPGVSIGIVKDGKLVFAGYILC